MNNETQTKENIMGSAKITQKQVDLAIKHFITYALIYESYRDDCEFESAKYWENHDKAINLWLSAESLEPKWPPINRRQRTLENMLKKVKEV
jgi:hypothetical protein